MWAAFLPTRTHDASGTVTYTFRPHPEMIPSNLSDPESCEQAVKKRRQSPPETVARSFVQVRSLGLRCATGRGSYIKVLLFQLKKKNRIYTIKLVKKVCQ